MKKGVLILTLGILLLSFVLVIAQANNSSINKNTVLNETNQTGDSGDVNITDGVSDDKQNETEKRRTIVNKTMTRLRDRNLTKEQIRDFKRNITFRPWQKINESECLEGCKCQGAVVSCPTENGKIITITAGRSGNVIIITIEKINVTTELELEEETELETNRTRLRAKLSDGRKAEIKVMPDVASQKALGRLKLKVCSEENNCSIEFKEVAIKDKKRLAYEMKAIRKAKFLGLFKIRMKVQGQIDAETGEIIKVEKPWWGFLASESKE